MDGVAALPADAMLADAIDCCRPASTSSIGTPAESMFWAMELRSNSSLVGITVCVSVLVVSVSAGSAEADFATEKSEASA